MIRSYRDLLVWQKAVDLAIECYRVSRTLPKSEMYGLASQVQRAAVSIAANIAEGHGREHLGDYLRHLSIANGSLMELETHLLIASRLKYLSSQETAPLLIHTSEIGRMLNGLVRRLNERNLAKSKTPDLT
ncbi:MAG TPA: four helix bundle protein [Thermoanaerobaculia bacterium]|jgi:four helix bundle protein